MLEPDILKTFIKLYSLIPKKWDFVHKYLSSRVVQNQYNYSEIEEYIYIMKYYLIIKQKLQRTHNVLCYLNRKNLLGIKNMFKFYNNGQWS